MLPLSKAVILTPAPYCSELQAYLQYVTTAPSKWYLNNLNTLIINLKNAGIWQQLDRFWIFATETQQAANVSIINPSSTQVQPVNNPTFTPLVGYQGNGTSSFVNTNYNPFTQGVNYTLNNCSLGYYNLTNNGSSNVKQMGSYDGTNFVDIFFENGNDAVVALNSGTLVSNATFSQFAGLFAGQRANNTVSIYFNGGFSGSNTNAAVAIPNLNLFIDARNNNGTAGELDTKKIAMAFAGSGNISQAALYTYFQQFATNIGFNV